MTSGRLVRAPASLVAQRPDEHADARLGLERRRLLRQQPARLRHADDAGRSPGAGISTATAVRATSASRALVDRVVVADPLRSVRPPARGSKPVVQDLDRGPVRSGPAQRARRAHAVPVGGHEGAPAPRAASASDACDRARSAADGRAALRRARQRGARGGLGGSAPRNSGVSAWSTSIARPRSQRSAGMRTAAAGGRRRSGDVRRRSARGEPASGPRRALERGRLADRPHPVPLGRRGRRTRAAGRADDGRRPGRARPAGPRCTSRIGAGFSCPCAPSGRRGRRTWSGWMPSCGQHRAVVGVRGAVRRCRGRRPGRGP